MATSIEIENIHCQLYGDSHSGKIVYVLYPMDILDAWAERTSKHYGIAIAVITDMDWQNVFSPWPAKGVPKGSPDFKGEAPDFLKLLCNNIVPKVETVMGFETTVVRTLVGVSMSGLFTLWQWVVCDTFANIASLSGSFWYDGFVAWFEKQTFPHKEGRAYFLLGEDEAKARVQAFKSVEADTREIVDYLSGKGVKVEFDMVPGNHYSAPVTRIDKAFARLFGEV